MLNYTVLFLIWTALAIFIEALVVDYAKIKSQWKKILFWVLTFPSVWILFTKKILAKYVPAGLAYKVKSWFIQR